MGQYENDGSVTVNLSKLLLLLVNMAFLVGGGLLIYFSQSVKSSGWLDAFQGDYAWIGSTTLLFVLVLGAVVVALATLGCFGAWSRNRILLTIYAVVLVVAAVLFIIVAIGASSVKSKATGWEEKSFPASSDESAVGSNFNQLYCYAQVTYYCDASVSEITSLFSISLPAAVSSVVDTYKVSQLCGSAAQSSQLDQLCDVCSLVNKYKRYAPVADWAQESCPRSATNQVWCGTFLLNTANGTATSDVFSNGAPYSECRTQFLDLIAKWSNFLFACALIVTISTVAVFGFACLVRQGTNRPYLDDSFVVDTP